MQDVLLVKYGEIVLRGKNRKLIEDNLCKTIEKNIKKIDDFKIYKDQGRFVIEKEDLGKIDFDTLIPTVSNVLGVSAVCPGNRLEDRTIENIEKQALQHMQNNWQEQETTFKVETKRSDKGYPMDSREISHRVGGYILNNMDNVKVDVHNPDITLFIEIRTSIYITSKIIKGFGGLPVGNAGKATLLLSGGIDSPVAGFMLAKRGVMVEAVYFHSPPYTSDRAKQKVIDLAEKLSSYTGEFRLNIVPFTDVQLKLYNTVQSEKLTILLKRAMLRIAEEIALENGSMGLITGDSVGQVASQTIHSIDAISSSVRHLQIFRPLCGLDKQEIVDIARKIGTFDISTRPYEDCCTIFVAKHPETKPRRHIIENIEKKIDGLDDLIKEAIENTEVIEF